jgi:hypothetical protein
VAVFDALGHKNGSVFMKINVGLRFDIVENTFGEQYPSN